MAMDPVGSGEASREWYRVATLKPRLRSHARIHRHVYRGQVWFVVQDPISGRYHRFTPLANECISLMNGERSVDEIWQTVGLVSQDDIIELLSRLHLADLLQSGVPTDADEVVERAEAQERRVRLNRWRTPLAVRVPLWDPETFLRDGLAVARLAFSRSGKVLWLMLVVAAVALLAMHWAALTENVADRVFALENLLLIALVFPVVKAVHELGHGFAVKVRGGEVHEMGIMFLVLVPVPYVEASSATAFTSKGDRMLVGAAGMMAEVGLAAVAMIVWTLVEPGYLRAVCFNVMLVAGVSTLVFNGNPLLRFDAYYILMDAIEIPNLASRANRYLIYLLHRYAYGVTDAPNPALAAGERAWFIGYGIASFCYRIFIMFAIAMLVASQYFVVGVVLAIWAVVGVILLPIAKGLAFLVSNARLAGHRARAFATTLIALIGLGALVGGLPVTHRTVIHGVVHAPQEQWVRVGHDGIVRELLVREGALVARGSHLLGLDDPKPSTDASVLEAQLRELEHRKRAAEDRVLVESIEKELEYVEERLTDAEQRQRDLKVSAGESGRVEWLIPERDLVGRYVRRGDRVGLLVADAGITIRMLAEQDVADLVRASSEDIAVRFADSIETTYRARLQRQIPAATRELPSAALSVAGGGEIATMPDAGTEQAYESLFDFEVYVDAPVEAGRQGSRAYVRFDHGAEPLIYRWYRAARQLLLSSFDV